MSNETKNSRFLTAALKDIKNNNFEDVYDIIRNNLFKGVCFGPNDPRPSSKDLLTKKEHQLSQALECTFWANKAAHLLEKSYPGISQNAYVIKAALLNNVLEELTNNSEKYADIFPSWGTGKDFEGKEKLLFDVPGHGQICFHTYKLNLIGLEDKIPKYPHTFVGTKHTFPDGKNPSNRHDQIVVDKCFKDLDKLGKDGDFFNTYKGIDIKPLYCTCRKDGKFKIMPYTSATSEKLQIDTIFGGVVKENCSYFLAVPKNTPPGNIEYPICLAKQPVEKLQDKPSSVRKLKPLLEWRIESKDPHRYQPPGSNIFFVGIVPNQQKGPFFTFKRTSFGDDNNRRDETFPSCSVTRALEKVKIAREGNKPREAVAHSTH